MTALEASVSEVIALLGLGLCAWFLILLVTRRAVGARMVPWFAWLWRVGVVLVLLGLALRLMHL